MASVLVTSGSTRIAYTICKTLAKHGFTVFVGERTRLCMAAASRHCSGSMRYASPFTQEERFLGDISRFVERHSIDILIPVLEESYTLAKNAGRFSCGAASFLPEYSQVLAVHDKGQLTQRARSLGIPVPETRELTEVLADNELLAALRFPVILKPKQGGGGWGMQKLFQVEELLRAVTDSAVEPANCIVQEFVEGQLIGVCAIYDNGRFLAGDSFKLTSSYPLKVGQSTTRESIADNDALESMKKLLDSLNWNGVCQMDFIVDEHRGKSYLLDANPRFWGSLVQNIAAGMDYPYYYCRLARGESLSPPGPARTGVRTRWLGGDIMRLLAECREAESKSRYLLDALRSGSSYAACDDWDARDPLPFFVWAFSMLVGKVFKRKKDALPGLWQ